MRVNDLKSVLRRSSKRLLSSAITLIAIMYLAYFGLGMARGGEFFPASVQAFQKSWAYLLKLLHGDLGYTIAEGVRGRPTPIVEILPEIFLRSFGLLSISLLFASIIGINIGVWSARRRHKPDVLLTIPLLIIGISLPSFFLAFTLQLIALKLTRFAGRVILPVGGMGWDEHLILPVLVLAARPLAQIARVTYVTLCEVFDQDYIRTARSKGLPPPWVTTFHVLRNAAVPVLTTIGLSLRFSLSSLPVVEYFFGWHGLGFTLLKTIAIQDDNFTVAMLLSLGLFFILINFILDASYRFIDPRTRKEIEHTTFRNQLRLADTFQSMIENVRHKLNRGLYLKRPTLTPLRLASISQLMNRRASGELWSDLHKRESIRLWKLWLRNILNNPPIMMGGVLVTGFVLIVLIGVDHTPHSPYTTRGLTYTGGEFYVPPFAPDAEFLMGTDVLGRDLLSLILAGAQQTFVLAALAVIARMTVGFLLGAIAGWWNGSWLDRFSLSLVEILAAFPTLLLAMNLILAFNIRGGMKPFIIALCFVGWGEVMQFVRGEVTRIRPRLFIESAIAAGARSSRILIRHVLPNLIPSLIILSIMELGAVLLLLGELGFVGIFIGGGIFSELEWWGPLYHYSDVPEWGALLSNVRTYARTYPWMGLFPGLAFFVAILGLNIFGEGLRRLFDRLGGSLMTIFNRYTFIGSLVVGLGFLYLRGYTGEIAVYRRQARLFDAQQAMAHVRALTDPRVDGRALGSPNLDIVANYVALKFEEYGLQPAGEEFSYFQTRFHEFDRIDNIPIMSIQDGGPELIYQVDYSIYPASHSILGLAESPVRFLALGELSTYERYGYQYYHLQDIDFSNEVLMIFEPEMAFIETVPRAGTLVISGDPENLQRRLTYSPYLANWMYFRYQRDIFNGVPSFWVEESTANRLLQNTNKTIDELRRVDSRLEQDEVYELPVGLSVKLESWGTKNIETPVKHVIGHLPGTSSSQFGGLDNRLIVVLAQYDCPPTGVDDLFYPGANDNASGVAVMLETIRNLQESGYQPYKTLLFIAYSGEGLDDDKTISPTNVHRFLEAKYGFASEFEVEAVIELRGLGFGTGDRLVLTADSSTRLATLFTSAARRFGVRTTQVGKQLELGRLFDSGSVYEQGEWLPYVQMAWEGWAKSSRLVSDSVDTISVDRIKRAGRSLSLGLMILGRETRY